MAHFRAESVRQQTAEVKELTGENLLSDLSQVRVIVTKDALREGWDCPFAYSLALLTTGTATTALTQMIGRDCVSRMQSEQESTRSTAPTCSART